MRCYLFFFFFSSRRRHTRLQGDWSSDVCSSDLVERQAGPVRMGELCATTAREHATQPLPGLLHPLWWERDRLPEAGSESRLGDSEPLRERRGRVEAVPQVDEMHVALEERFIHRRTG